MNAIQELRNGRLSNLSGKSTSRSSSTSSFQSSPPPPSLSPASPANVSWTMTAGMERYWFIINKKTPHFLLKELAHLVMGTII